jgi:hypothetical protein
VGSNPTGATSSGDVAQRQEQSLVRRKIRRFESGRPRFTPENPARFAGHDDFPARSRGFRSKVVVSGPRRGRHPLHGGRGVTAASEVVILEVPVRVRPAALPAFDFDVDLALSGRRRQKPASAAQSSFDGSLIKSNLLFLRTLSMGELSAL